MSLPAALILVWFQWLKVAGWVQRGGCAPALTVRRRRNVTAGAVRASVGVASNRADLARLATSPLLNIVTVPHGGHMGFMRNPWSESWAIRFVMDEMGLRGAQALQEPGPAT